jgi:hypothetical protein
MKFSAIWLILWLGVAHPLADSSSIGRGEKNQNNCAMAILVGLEKIEKAKVRTKLDGMNPWDELSTLLFNYRNGSSRQTSSDFSSNRTSPALVGSVMALLAIFGEAHVLPPEGSPQANQLIHGLIQLQSMLMKAPDAELSNYISTAADSFGMDNAAFMLIIHQKGLTSKVLEILVMYDKKMPIWDQPAIVQVFQGYNVSRRDWQMIEQIFSQATAVYRAQGSSIHNAYEQWRSQMPGGR